MTKMKLSAPIHTIIKLAYADLTIKFKSLNPSSEIDSILLAGHVIEKLFELRPSFGKPQLTVIRLVFCSKCKQESLLSEVDKMAQLCPKCGNDLRGDIEE